MSEEDIRELANSKDLDVHYSDYRIIFYKKHEHQPLKMFEENWQATSVQTDIEQEAIDWLQKYEPSVVV